MTLHFETTPLLNRSTSSSSTFNTAGQPMKKYGKLVLVDLAGSERLKVKSHLPASHLPVSQLLGVGVVGRGRWEGGAEGDSVQMEI